ncbi:hypothetical protein Phi17218_165 [Cellulophaga phage phi17:2_18]|uniref:Uncharacterized protein n=2 Tax=Lightbulbvirus Cba172 TaxID=1918525 RepID=S0A0F0_9CAUD|nr:hypothetical protein Phi17:2_gp165 [Cellulophaga phage phi17:2]AGO47698.1 hypothetical protein Phi17:2_gp165 [Cellulophaga phage phi17:2]ALO80568.1 hypothetical protein Phi17218_165 [Cellulophaga phage phi17:2_18]
MARAKIVLPSILTKDSWFYKENKDMCDPHLGKPYISYSTSTSWISYREDLIKQKFAKIKLDTKKLYAELGNYLGEAVEKGKFGENPNQFTGQENFNLIPRPEGAEYEKMILIDMGDYIILGFIDIFLETSEFELPEKVGGRTNVKIAVANVQDLKTGGKEKEAEYASEDYTQVILYAKDLENRGYKIGKTSVWFVRRTGSHVNPPLHISDEQFEIPLEYNEARVDFALKKIDKSVREISDCYKTYLKFFG